MDLDYTRVIMFIFIGLLFFLGCGYYMKKQSKYLRSSNIKDENKVNSLKNIESEINYTAYKKTGIILIVISGIPLLIYPFVLGASLMGLVVPWDEGVNIFLKIIVNSFCILTIIYPITYVTCLWFYLRKAKEKLAIVPFVHLSIIVILFVIWIKIGSMN